MRKAVFIDKDGTLIKNVHFNVNPALIELEAYAAEGLQLLQQHHYILLIVSNQQGVAFDYFSEAAVQNTYAVINKLLQPYGVQLSGFYYCPHHSQGTVAAYATDCDCRKPAPGMLLKAAAELDIDLQSSWMIGDILNDVEAGKRAGCQTILIDNGNETEWILNDSRQPGYKAANLKEAATIICTAS